MHWKGLLVVGLVAGVTVFIIFRVTALRNIVVGTPAASA